jgi:hypothetical protein
MKRLDQTTIDKMRSDFIGKRISVTSDKGTVVGICNALGYNEFFSSWGFQVTISRMPVSNVRINSVHLVEDKTLFKDGK